MTPRFQYLIDWDGDTVFTGSLDDITADVVDAEWFLGMRKAYQDCADESTLRLKVLNTAGKYNPENSSGTLYGKLKPRRRAMVRYLGGETVTTTNLVSYWDLDESASGTNYLSSLLAYWSFNETSGNRADSHTGGYTLTDNNTVLYGTGKQGNAAAFVRSATEYLSIADSSTWSRGDTDFTIAGWVYLDNKTNTQRIWGKYNTTGNQREYLLQYNSTPDRFQFLVSNDGTANVTVTANTFGSPTAATWYFVVVYHDSVNNLIGISVNGGAFDTTAHSTGIYNATSDFTISNPANVLDGRVDELAFYGRMLTSGEISYLYNSGSGRTYANLVSASATTRNDSHGSNHLTDNNATPSATGKQSNCASFTRSSSQYLSRADNATLSPGNTSFTFATWVKLDNKTNTQRILGKWAASNQEYLLQYDQPSDRFTWSVSDTGSNTVSVTASTFGSPSTATWYFVVVYHDATNDLIGISVNNGAFNTAAHSAGIYNGTADFIISGSTNSLDGDIDEVGYWSAVLSATEISNLYSSGSGTTYGASTTKTLWTGWVSKLDVVWTPAGSYTGKTFASIQCVGMKDQLQDTEIDLSLQQNKTGDDIIHEILRTVGFPPATSGIWTVGVSTVGGTDVIGSTSDYQDLETGTVTFDYYGTSQEKTDGWQALIDITAAERGRFYFGRDGKAYWWNRDHVENLGADDGTIDESGALGSKPIAVDYDYGDLLCNMVRVIAQPPRLDTESTTLFQLDSPVTIPPLTTVEIEALLTGRNGKRAATIAAALENGTFTSGTAEVALSLFGEKAIMRVTNSSAVTDAVLDTQDIAGQELSVQNKMMATAEDATSITAYGRQQELRLNLRALADFDDAQTIAAWELARRKDPLGHISSVTLLNKNDGSANEFQLNRTIGDRIRIKLAGLGHDSDHLLIGEKHAVRDGGQVHETTFYFEPVYPGT